MTVANTFCSNWQWAYEGIFTPFYLSLWKNAPNCITWKYKIILGTRQTLPPSEEATPQASDTLVTLQLILLDIVMTRWRCTQISFAFRPDGTVEKAETTIELLHRGGLLERTPVSQDAGCFISTHSQVSYFLLLPSRRKNTLFLKTTPSAARSLPDITRLNIVQFQ